MASAFCTYSSCSLTFLATLFVLLFVSCAIVLRSFLVRRRFRRAIEAQIAAGLLPPSAALAFRAVDLGAKPVLWDVALLPTAAIDDTWENVEPISAALLEKAPDDAAKTKAPHTRSPPNGTFARLLTRPRHRRPTEPPAPADTPPPAAPSLPAYADGTPLQLAVFVQMPAPPPRGRPPSSGEPAPIPEISVGVTSVPLRADG